MWSELGEYGFVVYILIDFCLKGFDDFIEVEKIVLNEMVEFEVF